MNFVGHVSGRSVRRVLFCLLIAWRTGAGQQTPGQAAGGATVSGSVRNVATGQAVENANVYLASTTIGTAVGKNGAFRLSNVPPGRYQIVFSCVGFETVVCDLNTDDPKSLALSIQMQPRVIALSEVEVAADVDDEAHRQYRMHLERFLEIFLGTRPNSTACRVLNPHDITVWIENDTTLRARADRPIVIENNALGYTLNVDLLSFTWGMISDCGSFTFYPRFIPMDPGSPDQREEWRENACESYRGSLSHFLSALYRDRTYEEGFRVQYPWGDPSVEPKGTWLESDRFAATAVPGTHYKAWNPRSRLRIRYRGEGHWTVSDVQTRIGEAIFDPNGTLTDPLALVVWGDWSHYRLADMLPRDFDLNKTLGEKK